MKTLRAALVAATALAAMPAAAEDIQMANITCQDFMGSSKEEIGNILAWLQGSYTKPSPWPIFSTTRMINNAKMLAEYCKAHGDDHLIKAADAVIRRQEL